MCHFINKILHVNSFHCVPVETYSFKIKFSVLTVQCGSWDGVVGIATRYRVEGTGIESKWGKIFCTYPDWLRGPPSLLYNGYRVFPGGKGSRGVMLTTHRMGPPGPITGHPLPFFTVQSSL
jgi:hypothetical protein